MFYDKFKTKCEEISETPNSVCLKLGFSNSTATYWKKSGKAPKRESLEKIAEHLGCTVDYLLDREPQGAKKDAPTKRDAVLGMVSRLSDDQLDRLLGYLEGILEK